jgi:tetratricopeptide (TPR) repeat protein
LSLALVSRELGKTAAAGQYITQALRYHSGDAEVHYLASYLAAQGGHLIDAEKRARTAVQLNPNYDKAYEILALILFRQNRFLETLDICDFRIGRNRNTMSAWYLKALSLHNMQRIEEALQVYEGALAIDPTDEVMRSALEILLREELPVEDARRKKWAAFHTAKADEARKTYLASTAHYEYQKALRIDPLNTDARIHYAQMLLDAGEPLRYLTQLDFVTQKTQVPLRIQDSIEAYRSLFSDTLGKAWNVDPFYLDKRQWKIALFYPRGGVQLIHEDAGKITAKTAADLFLSNPAVAVSVPEGGYVDFASSFRQAREDAQDYFAVMRFEENERELAVSAVVYSARTGAEAGKIRVFRTGNDRFASALRGFVTEFSALLPQRGKIIARNGNTVLLDAGKVDGFVSEAAFTIIKGGKLLAADTGFGLKHAADDALGVVTITKIEEEISEGVISKTGFYDRVNVGDDLVPVPPEASAQAAQPITQTAPRRGLFGRNREEPASEPAERYLPEGRTALKPPALAKIIGDLR